MGIGSEYHFKKWIEENHQVLTESNLDIYDLLKKAYQAGFDKGWDEGTSSSWDLDELNDMEAEE